MIGQEWDSFLVYIYTTVNSPPVENFAHGWKNDMSTNVVILFWRGVLRRSSFLGNLKALDKKLGLWRILTWIKYYPSMYCFQHFKIIFEGLGLVFKHFYMLQCIVSCSVLITYLIFTRGFKTMFSKELLKFAFQVQRATPKKNISINFQP
jgi:hypothetical protein